MTHYGNPALSLKPWLFIFIKTYRTNILNDFSDGIICSLMLIIEGFKNSRCNVGQGAFLKKTIVD